MKEADILLDKIKKLCDEMLSNNRKTMSKNKYLDRCLSMIEDMQNLEDVTKNFTYLKPWYVKSSFEIYLKMQGKSGPDFALVGKEIPMSALSKEQTTQARGRYAKMNWHSIGHAKPEAGNPLRGYYDPKQEKQGFHKHLNKPLNESEYWAAKHDKKR